MSDYNWCHGPECHEQETQSRVRGSGDNKVLRTIKIKQGRYNNYQNGIRDYFCNQRCLMDYIRTHLQSHSQSRMERVQQEKQNGLTSVKSSLQTQDTDV